MRTLTILLPLFMFSLFGAANAQGVISVNTTGETEVPADKISFHINLNARADTPQQAYDLHKKREHALVQLLKQYEIDEDEINFEPISISRVYNNEYSDKDKLRVQTSQSVILNFDDFSLYEKIQIALIDNDFDQFSGHFLSSKAEEGEEEALKKALSSARRKAEIIAGQTGVSITGIKEISHSYNEHPPRPMMEMRMAKSSDNLMEFEQTVTVAAHVSVTYKIRGES